VPEGSTVGGAAVVAGVGVALVVAVGATVAKAAGVAVAVGVSTALGAVVSVTVGVGEAVPVAVEVGVGVAASPQAIVTPRITKDNASIQRFILAGAFMLGLLSIEANVDRLQVYLRGQFGHPYPFY
jgi:hypothetical protein